ncbi:hypothetical protein MMC25_004222 [Agyrium rufum]|nr:hypothetical protein [Agyrium rufum]
MPASLHRASSDDSTRSSPQSPALSTTSTDSSSDSPFPQRISSLNAQHELRLFCKIRSNRSQSQNRAIRRTDSAPLSHFVTSSNGRSSFNASPEQRRSESRPARLSLRSDSSFSNSTPRTRSRSTKRNSGTVMQVGRHSNDWLFGGFSFTEAVKGLLSSPTDERTNEK